MSSQANRTGQNKDSIKNRERFISEERDSRISLKYEVPSVVRMKQTYYTAPAKSASQLQRGLHSFFLHQAAADELSSGKVGLKVENDPNRTS